MQLSDSLDPGGLERVAVNMANHLPTAHYDSHLCATRREGLLASLVSPHVRQIRLKRSFRFDAGAVRRLTKYIRENHIQILHAHGTSLFIAALASRFAPYPRVIWHDHYGRYATEDRPAWMYRLATRYVSGVIAVNQPLAEWSRKRLRMPADRVWYVPNFVCEPQRDAKIPDLPGTPGQRIVCVANLRPEKDHLNLLRAMRLVVRQNPAVHLLLLGNAADPAYHGKITEEMQQEGLAGHVSWLGVRNDVPAVLKGCDIGVLSSASEGLPLALIEYGMARLPAVATRVGQCEEVLDGGQAGLLVSPSAPDQLANAILSLLNFPERRSQLAQRFHQRVQQEYCMDRIIKQVCSIYDAVFRPAL